MGDGRGRSEGGARMVSAHSSPIETATIVDRFAEACVTSAARRWPVDLGDSMAYEWRAELAALNADRALGAVDRIWRSVKFAASLALSPSVEKENHISDWRERAPGLGRTAMAGLGILGVAMLATLLHGVAWSADVSFPPLAFLDRSLPVGNCVVLAAAIVLMAWIGTAAARRGTFGSADGSAVITALRYTAPIGLAVFAVQSTIGDADVLALLSKADLAFPLVTWVVVTTAALAAALRLARAGRRGAAWVVAIVGSLVALDAASILSGWRVATEWHTGFGLAPAWFPLSVTAPESVRFGHFWSGLPAGSPTANGISWTQGSVVLLYVIGLAAGPLLLCTASVVGYAMRASRIVAPAAAPAGMPMPAGMSMPAVVAASPARAFGLVRIVAAADVMVGLSIWTYFAAFGIAPHAVGLHEWDRVNLRIAAIALVVVAAVVLMAGRGPVALPATAIFAVLYAADCIVVHGQIHGQWKGAASGAVLFVGGAATVVGAWWLSGRLAGSGTTDDSARRTFVGAAIAGPMAVMTTTGFGNRLLPASFLGLSYLVAGALWLTAITAALASRRRPMSVGATIAYIVVPLAPLMLFVSGAGERMFGAYRDDTALLFIQIPLVVVALAAARWNNSGGVRSLARWLLLGVGGAIASFPLGVELDQLPILSGVIARYETDWNVVFANHLVLAIALGILAARLGTPPAANAITAVPVNPQSDPQNDLQSSPGGLSPAIA